MLINVFDFPHLVKYYQFSFMSEAPLPSWGAARVLEMPPSLGTCSTASVSLKAGQVHRGNPGPWPYCDHFLISRYSVSNCISICYCAENDPFVHVCVISSLFSRFVGVELHMKEETICVVSRSLKHLDSCLHSLNALPSQTKVGN